MALEDKIASILKEDQNSQRLYQLGRAGLFDAKKIQFVKRALNKDFSQLTMKERELLISTFHELIDLVTSNAQLFQRTKHSLAEETLEADIEKDISESVIDDVHHRVNMLKMHQKDVAKGTVKTFSKKWDKAGTKDLHLAHGKSGVRWFDDASVANSYALKEASNWDMQSDPPAVLVLKRKAIRVFPNEKKVALYHSDVLGKYISVPYGPGSLVTESTRYKREMAKRDDYWPMPDEYGDEDEPQKSTFKRDNPNNSKQSNLDLRKKKLFHKKWMDDNENKPHDKIGHKMARHADAHNVADDILRRRLAGYINYPNKKKK